MLCNICSIKRYVTSWVFKIKRYLREINYSYEISLTITTAALMKPKQILASVYMFKSMLASCPIKGFENDIPLHNYK